MGKRWACHKLLRYTAALTVKAADGDASHGDKVAANNAPRGSDTPATSHHPRDKQGYLAIARRADLPAIMKRVVGPSGGNILSVKPARALG